ncbi:hypothetical protein NIASO_20005 [Niabella soli DSM 19437]|uniref:Uncharacterized protein n=1 Tax=Niabella soli DSM 19437 TaxID=929713 RepID=W0F8D7_9BACT|nr:hypothetical protein NIASO_20005 [Niabella soli DSM 19437]
MNENLAPWEHCVCRMIVVLENGSIGAVIFGTQHAINAVLLTKQQVGNKIKIYE